MRKKPVFISAVNVNINKLVSKNVMTLSEAIKQRGSFCQLFTRRKRKRK